MIPLNLSMTLLVPSHKIKISSTNNRCVIFHETPMGTPFKLPFPFASLSSLLNPSSTKREIRGIGENLF
jgi:hypothetical protein